MIDRIRSEDDIQRGVRALRRRCPVARAMHDATGTPPVRVQASGFEGLARIIVGQQLSVASAAAIWGRCQQKFKPFTAERLSRARETTMKSVGLSAPKIRTLKAAATAHRKGQLVLEVSPASNSSASDQEIWDSLVSVKGIGPWTADIYLMFSLGRPDAFAPGDLALQIGAQHAFDLSERPTPDELTELAETWRPWRSVAARLLWAYYAHVKAAKTTAAPV